MENAEIKEFKGKVDYVMNPYNEIFGNNIAINPFYGPNADKDKRVIKVKTQRTIFACIRCLLRNKFGKSMTMDELREHVADRKRFVMILQLKEADLKFDPDLHTEVKSWVEESLKLLKSDFLTDEEILKHLPVKTLGIESVEGDEKMQLLFRDCKIVEKKGSITTLAILVKRVDPYIDPDTRKGKQKS